MIICNLSYSKKFINSLKGEKSIIPIINLLKSNINLNKLFALYIIKNVINDELYINIFLKKGVIDIIINLISYQI